MTVYGVKKVLLLKCSFGLIYRHRFPPILEIHPFMFFIQIGGGGNNTVREKRKWGKELFYFRTILSHLPHLCSYPVAGPEIDII